MSAEEISVLAGILLSLLFAYGPKVRDWFDGLDSTVKRLIMAACLLLVSLAAYGSACWDLGLVEIACDRAGAIGLGRAFVLALIANQSVYPLLPKPGIGA
jgi:hypothetical protein